MNIVLPKLKNNKTNYKIMVGHLGINLIDYSLSKSSVKFDSTINELDLIIDGHYHDYQLSGPMEKPLFVRSASYGQQLQVLILKAEDNTVKVSKIKNYVFDNYQQDKYYKFI
jgi:2',3'-cyclic-nucleotide 2'-phosphodiesterase (5'-nucleotidase family)